MPDGDVHSSGKHYRRPGWATRRILNPLMRALGRSGLSVLGSRTLETKGRRSGLPRRTPVNLLELDGSEYLVSARGDGEWVRNLRADGGRLTLLLAARREERVGTELPDSQKPPVLRAYLQRFNFEVKPFFDGVGPDSSEEDLLRIAPRHPVFVLGPPSPEGAAH